MSLNRGLLSPNDLSYHPRRESSSSYSAAYLVSDYLPFFIPLNFLHVYTEISVQEIANLKTNVATPFGFLKFVRMYSGSSDEVQTFHWFTYGVTSGLEHFLSIQILFKQ